MVTHEERGSAVAMKLLDAIYEVLSEAKEPMHYEDI